MSARAFGYTVSELGLVIAFLFMAVLVHENSAKAAAPKVGTRTESEFAALERERDQLRRELDAIKRKLKSSQLPTCVSKKVASGPIRDLTIVAADRFEVQGREMTSAELRHDVVEELKQARDCGCVQIVTATYSPDLSAEALDRALSRLEMDFYVRRLGAAK